MSKIILKQPLTKKNFFNELQEKYPTGMKVFCDWIDKYKEEVNWNFLFNAAPKSMTRLAAPKFHDLPYAFQLGVWLEFVCWRGGCQFEIEDMFSYDLREDITGYIKMMDEDYK